MKSLQTVALALILGSCQVQQAEPKPDSISAEETQLAQNLIKGVFDNVWGGIDTSKVSHYHTDDFIILEHGEIWDNDRIKDYMLRQSANPNRAKRTNRMEYISVDKYGASIQVAYHNFAEFTNADTLVAKARWLESALIIPTKDGWRLKMMHSTRVRSN